MQQFKSNPMVSKQDLLSWSGVPRSSFYYKRGDGIRGRKPSKMTITQDGELVDNTVVLQDVETILQQEFCCYGYKNVWDELKEKLEKIVYDGGTNYSTINAKTLAANEYLFFTDGLSTFGKNTVALSKPIHTINSAQKADYSTLKYISLKSGGQFINLNSSSTSEAFAQLNEEQLQFLGIKNNAEVRQTYPSMRVNVNGHLAVAGILSEFSTNVILQFGYGNTVVNEQSIRLDPNAQSLASINVSKIWAQKKIAEMDIQNELNKQEDSTNLLAFYM